jgi:drug/metabolite transporter (DMT)-like permease
MYEIPAIATIGSVLEASGMTLQKKILKKNKINSKNFTVYSFLALILVMLPLIFFFWEIKPGAFAIKNILIFLVVLITSIAANVLVFYALKKEAVTEIEPIRMMQPLFTILLAFIFSFIFDGIYESEKNPIILILAIIASLSLVWAHLKKHHLVLDKYLIAALIGSCLFSVELVISKSILQYYSNLTFYFIRCLFIFIITYFMFHPHIKSIKRKTQFQIILVSIIWIIYRMILYYGYAKYSVVLTTLVLSVLAPIFIYVFAREFLNEKITWKHIISSIIIVVCVIIAIISESPELWKSIITFLRF